MAGKDVYNITLPDGTTVPVPAWASESTMEMLAAQLGLNYSLDKKLVEEVYKINLDTSAAEKTFKDAVDKIIKNQRDTAKAEEKSRERFVKGLASSTSGLIDKLNNTEKPLSTFLDLSKSAASGLGKGIGELIGGSASGKAFLNTTFGRIGSGLADLGGDVAAALLGFNVAKLEQFEEAQRTMINAGAIFFEGARAYDNLYQRSIEAGISYTQMSKIVSEYGAGIQALGHGVSSGTDTFLQFFNDLNDSSDALGDFGLSSEQMARSYAEYINIARLTGRLNRDTINAQEPLSNSYKTLMLETTALASLTGQSRDEILQKRMASLSDPETAAALKIMRESGSVQQADLFESLVTQFAMAGEAMGAPGQQLMDAISREAFRSAENIEDFDVRGVLAATNPDLLGAFDSMDSGFIDGINQAVQTGEVAGGDILNFILKSYADLQDKGGDLARLSADASNPYLENIMAISAGAVQVSTQYRNLIDASGSELEAKIEESRAALAASGPATVAMNKVTESFMKLQERITVPLDDLGGVSETLATVMLDAVDWFKDTNQQQEVPIATPVSQADYTSRVENMMQGVAASSLGADLQGIRSEYDSMQPVQYDPDLLDEYGADPSTFEVAIHPILNQRVYRLPDQLGDIGQYMYMPPGLYAGGNVSANTPYIVGENRPGGLGELFVPQTAGRIFSNADAMGMFNMAPIVAAISQATTALGSLNTVQAISPVNNIDSSKSNTLNISNSVDVTPRVNRTLSRLEYPEYSGTTGKNTNNSGLKSALEEVATIKNNYLNTLRQLEDVVKHYGRLNDPLRS
jgi:hypothetical protein